MSDKPQSSSNGQQCSVCGHRNRVGVLVCENCGTQLVALTRGSTGSLRGQTSPKPENTPAADPKEPAPPAARSNAPAASSPVPEEHKSGTIPAADADTVKPGVTMEELAERSKPAPPSEAPAKADSPKPQPEPVLPFLPETVAFTAGKTCPNCGHINRLGVLICENCGTNLETGALARAATHSLESKDIKKLKSEAIEAARNLPVEDDKAKTGALGESASGGKLDIRQLEAMRSAGSALFEDEMVLRMEIDGAPTPILVYPKRETILGRRDPITGGAPDVDMTSYAGYRMGVSRQHAVIRLDEKRLQISDLGSSNGTFVNGVRLIPYQPHPLRDGDKIALGKMAIHLFFQSGVKRK